MQEIQSLVKKIVEKYNLETSVEVRFIDLISELGELGKEILKGNSYGNKKYELTSDFKNEIGDVFFSLVCVANTMEINLEDALEKTMLKYKKRFDEKGEIGSGK